MCVKLRWLCHRRSERGLSCKRSMTVTSFVMSSLSKKLSERVVVPLLEDFYIAYRMCIIALAFAPSAISSGYNELGKLRSLRIRGVTIYRYTDNAILKYLDTVSWNKCVYRYTWDDKLWKKKWSWLKIKLL